MNIEKQLADALRIAGAAIVENLKASGYASGSCSDDWVPEVRTQIAAVPTISKALAAYDTQPLAVTYSLSEIRNGTGFPAGVRFMVVKP